MKPQKLRSLLEPYGTINRIFLSPEDPTAHSRRVKNGGNKKRSFTDGWVEFVKKKDAKAAVDLLRGQVIGGKKGSYYRDDLWSLSYLKGFKWRKSFLMWAQLPLQPLTGILHQTTSPNRYLPRLPKSPTE